MGFEEELAEERLPGGELPEKVEGGVILQTFR